MGAPERLAGLASQRPPFNWADAVLPYFPGAPEELIEQAVMSVLSEFFRSTYYWVGVSPWLTGDGETVTFVVPSPEPETDVVYVFNAVTKNGVRIFAMPMVPEPGIQPRPEPGFWWRYSSSRPGVVTFEAPIPPTESVRFTVAMAPRTLRLPEALAREVQPYIVLGVRAWMHDMPLKPWTDAAAAGRLRQQYMVAMGRAKVVARMGHAATQLVQTVPDSTGGRWYR